MKTLDEVRELFTKDRFATENGAIIEEIGDYYAKCSLIITPAHCNAMGAVMGGVPFMLADFAFAVAANWQEMRTVSIDSHIAFVGAAKGQKLIAEARCLKNGHTTCYYTVEVKDDLGTVVAEVAITGFHKR